MRDTIDMASEAGLPEFVNNESQAENLEAFEALVRADEREACAKVCAEMHLDGDDDCGLAADAIRARGNT